MVKRCIGIDVGSSYLRAVQILRMGERFHIEKVFRTQTRRSTDSLSDILKTLTRQHGFDRRAGIAISMPRNSVFFKSHQTDSVGVEQTNGPESSSLEHDFPIQPDETVTQVYSYRRLPGDKYFILTAAVSKESLHERLDLLVGARIRPNLIDAAIFAIHSSVTVNHPEIKTGQAIIAYIDESCLTMAITENDNILIVRNIPVVHPSDDNVDSVREQVAKVFSHEAQISWRKVFQREIGQDTKIYLISGDDAFDGLESLIRENLHCQTVIVNPYAKVKCSVEHNGDAAICVAEGLAMRGLAPEGTTGVNFLEADNADTRPVVNLKKEFMICATLIVAIAVVWFIGLFVQLTNLEAEYAQVKNEIEEVFQRVLPEEKHIVNPLVQLDQKLQSIRADFAFFGSTSKAAIGPLDVLRAVTNSIPPGATIENILITTESVRLAGTFQSFESVYNWQRLLQEAPQFSTVDVQDIRRESQSKLVRFTILASLSARE